MSQLDHMKEEWCCDCSAPTEPVSTSSEVTLSTLSFQENGQERAPQKNTLTANLPILPHDYSKEERRKKRWYVMWATRGILAESEAFYKDNNITTFAPFITKVKRVKKRLKKERRPVINNKIFVYISAEEILTLNVNPLNKRYTKIVPDLTGGSFRNRPPMIASDHDMRKFINHFGVGDKFADVVGDDEKVDYKYGGELHVVTDGPHKNLIGRVARIKKQTCLVTNIFTLNFKTGYIPDAFLTPLGEALEAGLFDNDEEAKEMITEAMRNS